MLSEHGATPVPVDHWLGPATKRAAGKTVPDIHCECSGNGVASAVSRCREATVLTNYPYTKIFCSTVVHLQRARPEFGRHLHVY
jgi:hypothetical protein